MFGKIFSDTLIKVRHKADDIRLQVSHKAAKARDILGLGGTVTAQQLEAQLDASASQVASVNSLNNLCTRWTSLILQSEKTEDLMRYADVIASETDNSKWETSFQGGTSTHSMAKEGGVIKSLSAEEEERHLVPVFPLSKFENISVTNAELDVDGMLSSAGLTFKQVFLRSRAINNLLLRISCEVPEVAQGLLEGPPIDDTEPCSVSVFAKMMNLLALVLDGDPQLHRDLLYFLLTAGEGSPEHLQWALSLLSSLQKDSHTERLVDMERHIKIHLEHLKSQLLQSDVPTAGEAILSEAASPGQSAEGSSVAVPASQTAEREPIADCGGIQTNSTPPQKRENDSPRMDHGVGVQKEQHEGHVGQPNSTAMSHDDRIKTSLVLIKVNLALQANLKQQLVHRQKRAENLNEKLELLHAALGKSSGGYICYKEGANERKENLQRNLAQESEKLLLKVADIDVVRTATENQIAGLVERKQALLQEIDDIDGQIREMRGSLDKLKEDVSSIRGDLETVQLSYRGKLVIEGKLQQEAQEESLSVENLKLLANKANRSLLSLVSMQAEATASACDAVKPPLEAALYRHFAFEKERLRTQTLVVENLLTQWLTSAETTQAAERLDSRHQLSKAIARLEQIWKDVCRFHKDSSFLLRKQNVSVTTSGTNVNEEQADPFQSLVDELENLYGSIREQLRPHLDSIDRRPNGSTRRMIGVNGRKSTSSIHAEFVQRKSDIFVRSATTAALTSSIYNVSSESPPSISAGVVRDVSSSSSRDSPRPGTQSSVSMPDRVSLLSSQNGDFLVHNGTTSNEINYHACRALTQPESTVPTPLPVGKPASAPIPPPLPPVLTTSNDDAPIPTKSEPVVKFNGSMESQEAIATKPPVECFALDDALAGIEEDQFFDFVDNSSVAKPTAIPDLMS